MGSAGLKGSTAQWGHRTYITGWCRVTVRLAVREDFLGEVLELGWKYQVTCPRSPRVGGIRDGIDLDGSTISSSDMDSFPVLGPLAHSHP